MEHGIHYWNVFEQLHIDVPYMRVVDWIWVYAKEQYRHYNELSISAVVPTALGSEVSGSHADVNRLYKDKKCLTSM